MDIKEAITEVVEGRDLPVEAAADVMRQIMAGEASEAQFGAFVTALRLKGETPEEIATDFEVLRQSGWDHSTLDLAEAVHVSADKVHFRIVFSRYTADGSPYTTAPGLYVITNQNGHWGLQLQSTLPATFTR